MNKMNLFLRMKLPEIQLYRIKTYISLSNFDQKLTHFDKRPFAQSIITNFLHFLTTLTTPQSIAQ